MDGKILVQIGVWYGICFFFLIIIPKEKKNVAKTDCVNKASSFVFGQLNEFTRQI